MTTPKEVSKFAKEYQNMYIALVQCKSAYAILKKKNEALEAKLADQNKVR